MVRAAPAKKRSSSAQIGSSSAASECGLPTLSDSSAASSSPWRSTVSASASSSSWRLPGVVSRQGIRAARAAATARSTSAALPSGTRAMISPVAGLRISRVAPSTASTSSPPTRLRCSRTAVALTPSPARVVARPMWTPASLSTSCRRATISSISALSAISGGRDLQDRVAAVIGARDDPRLAQAAGQEAAQQLVALGLVEGRVVIVLDKLHRPEEAVAADVADDRQVGERAQRLGEVGRQGAHVLQHAVALEDLHVLERDRRGDRVAAERDAVAEDRAALDDRRDDRLGGDHGAHRRVGRRQALGQGHQVGRDALAAGGDPLAQAPAAADDLVGHQQRAVLVGQRAQALPVAGRGDEAAAGVLHGLGDDQRDLVGAGGEDRVLDLGQQHGAERRGVGDRAAAGAAEHVGVGDVGDVDRRAAERLLEALHAGERQRAERDAVVGDVAGDRLGALRLADREEVLARELPRRLDRLRAAAGEEDAVHAGRRDARRAWPPARSTPGAPSPSWC